MSEKASRSPLLDEWRERIAIELRMYMAARRVTNADAARAMGMKEAAFGRRLNGYVSFTAEEVLFLADWMDRNVDDILAAAKAPTNPCLSADADATAQSPNTRWARWGKKYARKVKGQSLAGQGLAA